MNTHHHQQPHTADAGAAQAASLPAEGSAAGDQGLPAAGSAAGDQGSPAYQQIKLALDVHAATIVVVRMLDGAKPQPPQTMKPADFLAWVQKQKTQAREVVSCYEAGPTGFWLHRRLSALGVRNYVVCPTRLDERHRGVANDRPDALELATRLDRFLAGNDKALALVRVPTEAEEQARARKRQRQQLRQQRLSLVAQGRSLMLARIAGRDVCGADGHTVGKTLCRNELIRRPGAPRRRQPELAGQPLDADAPAMIRKRHHRTGRGRSASVTGRPVSLVPILSGDRRYRPKPNHKTNRPSQLS